MSSTEDMISSVPISIHEYEIELMCLRMPWIYREYIVNTKQANDKGLTFSN